MGPIFISFVEENAPVARHINHILKSNGLETWFSKESIPPGAFWRDRMRRGITDGAKFLPIYSKEWAARDRTVANEELAFAINEARRRLGTEWLIPVSIDGTMLPDFELHAGKTLRDIHCENLLPDWSRGMRRVLQALGVREPKRLAIL